MIKEGTVLVLGAGASMPYGFPSGREMLLDISRLLIKNQQFQSSVIASANVLNAKTIPKFGKELEASGQPSIDAFLESRVEYLQMGKAAIAQYLIPKENIINFVRLKDNKKRWFEYLFNQIGTKLDDFLMCNLNIVTFNYDRSFEYLFFNSLKNAFNPSEEDIEKIFENIKIVHVYGNLTHPHFLDSTGRDYTSTINIDTINKTREALRIIPENRKVDTPEMQLAKVFINNANQICFLGFGYLKENIDRLFEGIQDPKSRIIMGSCYGMSQREIDLVWKYFNKEYSLNLINGRRIDDAINFLRNTKYLFEF